MKSHKTLQAFSLFAILLIVSCQTDTQNEFLKIDVNKFQQSKLLWDLDALSNPPNFFWVDSTSSVRSLIYESVDYEGKPTQVFAYYSNPDLLRGQVTRKSFPGVVLVHGGGGKAFKEWVEKWAADGYAAIAMDLGGKDADGKPFLKSGPDQTHEIKFSIIEKGDLKNVWSYHAVASVILAHSFLLNRPEVNAEKTCLTGISWGGYLTCIVAGLDDRFKAAAPVYGCAYYNESDVFGEDISQLSPFYKKQWLNYFDPSVYLPFSESSLLFINGNKDRFYNIVPYHKTYNLPNLNSKNIRIQPNMKHSHVDGWEPIEIRYFFESVVNGGIPLPKIGEVNVGESSISTNFRSVVGLRSVRFYYSSDTTSTNAEREWSDVTATIDIENNKISCALPNADFEYAFFHATDIRGLSVSSPIYVKP